MKKINVLINGVGGILGQGIIKSLRRSKYSCFIVGMDANPLAYGLFQADKAYKIPSLSEKRVLDKIVEICLRHKIDIVFPALEQDTLFFARNCAKIEKTGAIVIVNDEKIVRLFNDKWRTYQWLCKNNIKTPPTIRINDNLESIKSFIKNHRYPLILKPRHGHGGKDTFKINSLEEITSYSKKPEKFLLQKYIGTKKDVEFTCGAFIERTGALVDIMILQRKLSREGHTKEAIIDRFPSIRNECIKIIDLLNLRGFFNVQLRLKGIVPYVLEINPRISSSNSIRTLFGFNEPEMAITSFVEQKKVPKPKFKKGTAVRYIDDFAIYSEIKVSGDGKVRLKK